MVERVEILDDVTWGQLVKTWATGTSYLPSGYVPPHYPRTIAEFHDQCAAAKGTTTNQITKVPASMTAIAVLQYSEQVVVVRLPPKSMVEAVEAELQSGASYPIPKFYDNAYHMTLTLDSAAEKLDFQAARIGDYSIRQCG